MALYDLLQLAELALGNAIVCGERNFGLDPKLGLTV
jgi:hypothetical protein